MQAPSARFSGLGRVGWTRLGTVVRRSDGSSVCVLILLYTDLGVTGSGSIAGPLRATVQRGPIYPTPSGSPSVDGMYDPLLPAVEVSIASDCWAGGVFTSRRHPGAEPLSGGCGACARAYFGQPVGELVARYLDVRSHMLHGDFPRSAPLDGAPHAAQRRDELPIASIARDPFPCGHVYGIERV